MDIQAWGAEQYKCFEAVRFEMPDGGVWSVTGENRDEPGFDHNGCGKTSLLDIPKIALFGAPSGVATADLTRRGARSFMVWVEFEHRGAAYRVERAPSTVRVFENGARTRVDSRRLPAYFGMSRLAFSNAVSVKFGELALLTLRPEQRTEFFLQLAGLDFADELARAMRGLGEARQKIGIAVNDQHRLESALERLRGRQEELVALRRREITSEMVTIAEEKRRRAAGALAAAAEYTRKAQQVADMVEAKIAATREEWNAIRVRQMELTAGLERHKNVSAEACPTCGRPWPKSRRREGWLPPDAAQAAEQERQEAALASNRLAARMNQMEEKLGKAREAVETARGKEREAEAVVRDADRAVEDARRIFEEQRTLQERIDALGLEIVRETRRRVKAGNRVRKMEAVEWAYQYWRNALQPRGRYTLHCLQGVLDVVAASADGWLARFYRKCRLVPEVSAEGRGLAVTLNVEDETGAPFDLRSTGERQRIALALFFAANQMFRQVLPINYLALDDFDFGLDARGVRSLAESLRDMGRRRTILLATQSEAARRLFPRQVRVVKESGVSRLEIE